MEQKSSEADNNFKVPSKEEKVAVKVKVVPLDGSTKGMMDHLKVPSEVKILIKGEVYVGGVFEALKQKQWKKYVLILLIVKY